MNEDEATCTEGWICGEVWLCEERDLWRDFVNSGVFMHVEL